MAWTTAARPEPERSRRSTKGMVAALEASTSPRFGREESGRMYREGRILARQARSVRKTAAVCVMVGGQLIRYEEVEVK